MGTRYYINVMCPVCGLQEADVYYAPICGIDEWTCPECGCIINLAEYTGISYEEASNKAEIEKLVDAFSKKNKTTQAHQD